MDWRAIRSEEQRSQERQPHPGHGAIDLRTGRRTTCGRNSYDRIKLCARVSGQGARSGTNFTRSSEPASWMA